MENNVTKILIKEKSGKVCDPRLDSLRYDPPLLLPTFTDDPASVAPALPPKKKRTFPYKQNFTGRLNLYNLRLLNAQLHSKGLETSRKLTQVGGLTHLAMACLQVKGKR